MLTIGTSGFAYDDWRGHWYPPGLPRARYFDYYAERFSAIEINSTFYHIYAPRMMESLVRRAAGRVRFAVKMSEYVTHRGLLNGAIARSYAAGIAPAWEAGVLDGVLLQFPQRFHFTPGNREYLDKVRRVFACFPLIAEIRHRSWQSPEAWRYLRGERINLCLMDMPRLTGLPAGSIDLTGDVLYIRFHGRNSRQWWDGQYPGARYDYYYSDDELEPWVEPVRRLARKADSAMAFFNNHVRAKAPVNAERFRQMLGQEAPRPAYKDLLSDQAWFG